MDGVKKDRSGMGREMLILIVALLLCFAVPAFLIFFSPVFLFRYLLSQLSGWWRPDLGQMLSSSSATIATDDMYKKPRANAMLTIFFEGELELEAIRREMRKKAVERRLGGGELKYPELQQCISSWLGFAFWKWDTAFHINNHVRYYDGPLKDVWDERSIQELNDDLLGKAWNPTRSPWELLVLPNNGCPKNEGTTEAKTICVLRSHHALADGFAIFKLMVKDVGGEAMERPPANQPLPQPVWARMLDGLRLVCRLAYDTSSMTVKSYDPASRFHFLSHRQLSRRTKFVSSPNIPLTLVKQIQGGTEASTLAIGLAAYTAALRTFMLERDGALPAYVSVDVPIPAPAHPDKLTNHFSATMLSLPVGLSDPEERLAGIDAELRSQKTSTYPIVPFWVMRTIGALPSPLTAFLSHQRGPTAIISAFPGPRKQIGLFGRTAVDWMFNIGFGPGNIGIGCFSRVYNGNMKLCLGIDESVLASWDRGVDGFMESMLKELDILKETTKRRQRLAEK